MSSRASSIALTLVATECMVACSSSPSMLIFADNATLGLKISGDTATGGASVTLGFKNHSVAIVPMSVVDGTGRAWKLNSEGGDGLDALSVFAVFDASGAGQPSVVNAGQMFSTGVAAQYLTRGYMCRSLRSASECRTLTHVDPAPPANSASAAAQPAISSAPAVAAAVSAAQASAKSATASAHAADTSAAAARASADAAADSATAAASAAAVAKAAPNTDSPDGKEAPYQWPLVFGRADVLGFDIAGSPAEQGTAFVLGYGARNLALVPTYVRTSDPRVQPSGLWAKSEDVKKDAFSVLGQFRASTETAQLGFGINRYFATGLAAQNLSRGIAAAVAASAPASGPKP